MRKSARDFVGHGGKSQTRNVLAIVTATALLGGLTSLLPRALAAITLSTEGGFSFDINDTRYGSIGNGTRGAYNTAYSLEINSLRYSAAGVAPTTTLGGRGIETAVKPVDGFNVKRLIYVPSTGGAYARFVDVIENPTATAKAASVRIYGNLGSNDMTTLTSTGSGNTVLTTTDGWFVTDDGDGPATDPGLGHVFAGRDPQLVPSVVSLDNDEITWTFTTTIPAGERIAILTFAVQTDTAADAAIEAARIATTPVDTLVGLDDYVDDIVNFPLATSPIDLVFTGDNEADEGAAISIGVEATAAGAVTYSWDLNADGTFGDMPGVAVYSVGAETTDGPSAVRVGVRAASGEDTVTRYHSVAVVNVVPTITSTPDDTTTSGARYSYQLAVTDPAGSDDPLMYLLTDGPSDMTVSSTGLIEWQPTDLDVTMAGQSERIEVKVSDGDGGFSSQNWQLTVSANRIPSAVVPLYPVRDEGVFAGTPRLIVQNAEDADFNALSYYFQIDTVNTFDSAALRESGAIAETEGYTAWTLPEPLLEGRYFWKAWASDGAAMSEPVVSSFYAVPIPVEDAGIADGGLPDAGPRQPTTKNKGCAVSDVNGVNDNAGSIYAFGFALLLAARGSRRRIRTATKANKGSAT